MKRTTLKAVKTPHDIKLYDKGDRELPRQDAFLERKLLTGIIVNDEVIGWVDKNIRYDWIQSVTARKIVKLVLQYYDEFGKAPKMEMEGLYFDWLKNGKLTKEEAEELEEDLLPELSEEAEKGSIDTKFLIQQAGQYFEERRLQHHSERIREAINIGDIEQAEFLAKNPPTSLSGRQNLIVRDIDDYANLERPKMIMSPWLREGEYSLVYADKGVGKTMFAVLISYLLSCEKYKEPVCEIRADDNMVWQVKRPAKTLYVAGEMAQGIMDRFAGFRWMGDYIKQYKPRIIDRGEQQAQTNQPFSLSTRSNQQAVIQHLKKNPDVKLVVLDNVQTLFDLEDSNRESEWSNKINPLLQDLEDAGVACLLLDHTGKDASRGAMGTHAKITRASYAIHLKDHADKKTKNGGQAWFKVCPDYARYPEGAFEPFYLRFWETDGDTEWEVTGGQMEDRSEQVNRIISDIIRGDKQKDIASRYGLSPSRISQIKSEAEEEGLMEGGNPTMEGFDFMKQMEEDD